MTRIFHPQFDQFHPGLISHYKENVMNIDQRLATLTNLQNAVHQWSHANFGDQISKAITIGITREDRENHNGEVPLPLGSLAPLLGLVEELGEYNDARVQSDVVDAISDIGIYLLDYCWREGANISVAYKAAMTVKTHENQNPRTVGMHMIVSGIGHLCHCTLKRHQGIRDMDIPAVYQGHRDASLAKILAGLEILSQEVAGKSCIDLMGKTFLNIVKKRNWLVNPQGAVATDKMQQEFNNASSN